MQGAFGKALECQVSSEREMWEEKNKRWNAWQIMSCRSRYMRRLQSPQRDEQILYCIY